MAARKLKSDRREDALSRERIVEAAIALLDEKGEEGLTFRALTERLSTGAGAIYWHVESRDALVDAASEAVMATVLDSKRARAARTPREEITAVALGLYDVMDAHAWLSAQLSTQFSKRPWKSTTPRLLETLGRQVRALGVPKRQWFTATFTLVHYILSAAGLNAANGRVQVPAVDRSTYLDSVSKAWEQLDPVEFSFMHAITEQLRTHDDRDEFLAGLSIVVAGITGVSARLN